MKAADCWNKFRFIFTNFLTAIRNFFALCPVRKARRGKTVRKFANCVFRKGVWRGSAVGPESKQAVGPIILSIVVDQSNSLVPN